MRPLIVAFAFGLALAGMAQAEDKAEYYYPPVSSEEVFDRSLGDTPPASRDVRIGFVTQITKAQLAAPESPRFVVFAKGDDAQHMIIVALDDQIFRTLYRARALLAQLTANVRGTDFFVQNKIETSATWFDLARILGFEDLVISDGVTWTHRVVLE
jgi:hypothetical protein